MGNEQGKLEKAKGKGNKMRKGKRRIIIIIINGLRYKFRQKIDPT